MSTFAAQFTERLIPVFSQLAPAAHVHYPERHRVMDSIFRVQPHDRVPLYHISDVDFTPVYNFSAECCKVSAARYGGFRDNHALIPSVNATRKQII